MQWKLCYSRGFWWKTYQPWGSDADKSGLMKLWRGATQDLSRIEKSSLEMTQTIHNDPLDSLESIKHSSGAFLLISFNWFYEDKRLCVVIVRALSNNLLLTFVGIMDSKMPPAFFLSVGAPEARKTKKQLFTQRCFWNHNAIRSSFNSFKTFFQIHWMECCTEIFEQDIYMFIYIYNYMYTCI